MLLLFISKLMQDAIAVHTEYLKAVAKMLEIHKWIGHVSVYFP